jgi:hypothetical protein
MPAATRPPARAENGGRRVARGRRAGRDEPRGDGRLRVMSYVGESAAPEAGERLICHCCSSCPESANTSRPMWCGALMAIVLARPERHCPLRALRLEPTEVLRDSESHRACRATRPNLDRFDVARRAWQHRPLIRRGATHPDRCDALPAQARRWRRRPARWRSQQCW